MPKVPVQPTVVSDDLDTVEAMIGTVSAMIDRTESARDVAALTKRLMDLMALRRELRKASPPAPAAGDDFVASVTVLGERS